MSAMDMNDGPSSSYQGRGGRGWGSGGRTSNYRGRGGGRYEQENYYQARGGGRGSNYNNGNSWNNNSYNSYNNSSGYPNSRGGGQQQGAYRGRSSGYWGNTNRGGRSNYQGRGGGRGRGRGFEDPEDVEFVRIMRGHTMAVTSVLIDPATSQVYTGSKDQTVRVWNPETGQCTRTVEVGGEVDSMLFESGFLFVGLHVSGDKNAILSLPGNIKVYNMTSAAEHTLQGHMGPVYCLAAANNMLFSGGHDQSIRVWQFNQPAGLFEAAAVLMAAQGGHSVGVKALRTITMQNVSLLFSADLSGTIKVWDMSSGQCVQSIQQAHRSVVMSLLAWEGYLLSGSVDGTVKIWQPAEHLGPGAVVDAQPAYSHPPQEGAISKGPEDEGMFGQVLTLTGTVDPTGKPVLLTSYSLNNQIRLWELPTFTERGHLNAIKNAMSVACSQTLLVAGDYVSGAVKVWRWKAAGMPVAI